MGINDFRLDGKAALVTGSGRGIGLGIAEAFASAGGAVAIHDIDEDAAQAAVEKIRAAGGNAVAFGGDITDLTLPERLINEAKEKLGGLHILVNNASIQQSVGWRELTIEQIERDLQADLISPLLFCREATPIFQSQQWGRILNIGSIQAKGGNPNMLAYSMSKVALENMTKALARELGKDGVTVNLLSPGYYNTWRNRDEFENPQQKKETPWLPIGRAGMPEDCGGPALLLCSDAGRYVTGQVLYVDGGMSAR